MSHLLRRLVVVGVIGLTAQFSACGGTAPSKSPSAPSFGQPSAPVPSVTSVPNFETLNDAEDIVVAAAVSLSGTWTGTTKSNGRGPYPVTVKFIHSGKKLTGTVTKFGTKPVLGVTFTMTESSVSGAKRTFTGSFKIVAKGSRCSPATMTGSLVADTKQKTMTGSFKGKNTDCLTETNTFSLKKV